VDDNGAVLVVSGSSELRVGRGADFNIATDERKINTMGVLDGAIRVVDARVVVVFIMVIVVVGVFMVMRILMVVVVVMVRVMSVRIIVMVWVVVSGLGLIRNDVVVRVAIISDESAASIVTGDFDLIERNRVVVDDVSLAVSSLVHRLVLRDSGGSKLGVGVRRSVGVASSLVELDTVSASRLMVVRLLRLIWDEIVMRVAVIIDQGAACVIASDLNLVKRHGVVVDNIGLTVRSLVH